MGRKNFVENYDPLRSHVSRDDEKRAASATAAAQGPQTSPLAAEQRSLSGGGEEPLPRAPVSVPRPSAPTPRRAPLPVQDLFASGGEVSPRIKVSGAAFQDLETMLSNLHRTTGSQVHYSIATRALWGLLVLAEAQVLEELKKMNLGRLPSTREKVAYAEYEERVKQAFAQAFRRLPKSIFKPLVEESDSAIAAEA